MAKAKHSFKEKWGSFKNFAKGEPLCAFMGDSYIEKTNIMDRREWRGFVDTAYDFAWWLGTWGKMSGLILRDPVRMVRAFWRYRWLSGYLCTPAMVDRWTSGDRGIPLRADHHAINAMVSDSIDTIWKLIRADRHFGETKWTERTIGFDYTLPKHIMFGFPGYEAINIQQHPAFMIPIMNKHYGCYYIDQAVSTGIPQDMCTLPLVEVGVAVEDEYPDIGNCYLATNNPCDANMMDNAAMYRRLSGDGKKAVHAFVTPLMYDDPTTKELGVHEIYSAIEFLEGQFGQKFDWDAFADGIRRFNELNIHETNKWDVYAKCDNIAMNSMAQAFWRIYMYQQGANKHFEREAKVIWKYFAALQVQAPGPGLELRLDLLRQRHLLALPVLGHPDRHQHGLAHGPQHRGHRGQGRDDERHCRPLRPLAHAHAHGGRQPAHPDDVRDGGEVQLRHDSDVRRHRLQGHGRLPGPVGGGVPQASGVPHHVDAARADGLPHGADG